MEISLIGAGNIGAGLARKLKDAGRTHRAVGKRRARDEVGRRVLRAVFKYQDLDEAIRLANGTPYGLGASVWCKDPELLNAVARRLDAGTVWINQHLNAHPNIPFSGHKNSGIGIEFSEDGLKEFCNVQVIANKQ
jgi:hypothetical protein